MYRGRTAQAQQAAMKQASAQPSPVIAAQAPVHAGVLAAAAPAPVQAPKLSLIRQDGALPSGSPFSSANNYVEYTLPTTLGKLTDLDAEFVLTFTAPSDDVDVTLAPSPFLVSRVDWLVDNQVVESVHCAEIWTEAVTWRPQDELVANAARWFCTPEAGVLPSFQVAEGATVSKTVYLPLGKANFLIPTSPYIKGIRTKIGVRLYLAASSLISAFLPESSTPATINIGITSLNLFATEASLTARDEAGLASQYARGAVLKSVFRHKAKSQSFASVQNTSLTQFPLTGHAGRDSAGLVTYAESTTNATIAEMMSHAQLKNWQLMNLRILQQFAH